MNRRLCFLAGILLLFALIVRFVPMQKEIPLTRSLDEFPLEWKGWSGEVTRFSDFIEEVLGTKEYMSRYYRRDGKVVVLYVGYYPVQKVGSQIHSPKHCLPGAGWSLISQKTDRSLVDGFGDVKYVEAIYQLAPDNQLFMYWYQMKGTSITSDYSLKLQMILHSLRYRRNEAAFIRLSTPITGSPADSEALLGDFMKDFLPLLRGFLPE